MQFFELREQCFPEQTRNDDLTGCIGMDAVALIQVGIAGHALEQKWNEYEQVSCSKVLINGMERLPVIRTHASRHAHPGEDDPGLRMRRADLVYNSLKVRAGHLRCCPAKTIVGAELQDK